MVRDLHKTGGIPERVPRVAFGDVSPTSNKETRKGKASDGGRTIDTETDSALEVLLGARLLICTGWCQHADGRNRGGWAVEPWDRSATSWSLLGALVAQTTPLRLERGELEIGALRMALGALADVLEVDSLTDWNDDPSRTATDVSDILARAIRRLDLHPDHEPPCLT